MRIAQVAPLYESVPPRGYGGTERVVSYLTEALVDLGHEVTLFASGDSVTRARLRPQSSRALRMSGGGSDPVLEHLVMIEQVAREALDFDVIHFHTDHQQFLVSPRLAVAHVSTLHGRLDLPHIERTFRTFGGLPFISISDAQRRPMPWLNWMRTIHHGLPEDLYAFTETPEHYLLFLGRVSPEKGLDRAIEIAVRTGLPLKIAAKLDLPDQNFFDTRIRPLLAHPLVEFLGEVGEPEKRQLLSHALAMLFPIDWPEPFGMVMIEAMACGTPVIAFPQGSVPEVIVPGETGVLVNSVDEAVAAVQQVGCLNRRRCRAVFERRFTARRMALDHLAVYSQLMENNLASHAGQRARSGGSVPGPSAIRSLG